MIGYLYTFNNVKKSHGLIHVNNENLVNGEYPIEDFGNYYLSKKRVSLNRAYSLFLKEKLLKRRESSESQS